MSDERAIAERRAAVEQAIADLQAALRRDNLADMDECITAAMQSLEWAYAEVPA
jgi:hypothetical protein